METAQTAAPEVKVPYLKIIRLKKPSLEIGIPTYFEEELLTGIKDDEKLSQTKLESLQVGDKLEGSFFVSDEYRLLEIPQDEPSFVGSECYYAIFLGNPNVPDINEVRVHISFECPDLKKRIARDGTEIQKLPSKKILSYMVKDVPEIEGLHTLKIAVSHDQGIGKVVTMNRLLKFNSVAPFNLKWRIKQIAETSCFLEVQVGNRTSAPLLLEKIDFQSPVSILVEDMNEGITNDVSFWDGSEAHDSEKDSEKDRIVGGDVTFEELHDFVNNLDDTIVNSYLGQGDSKQFLFRFYPESKLNRDLVLTLGTISIRWASPQSHQVSQFVSQPIVWKRKRMFPVMFTIVERPEHIKVYEPFKAKISITNNTTNTMNLRMSSDKDQNGGIVLDGPFRDIEDLTASRSKVCEFEFFPLSPGLQTVQLTFVDTNTGETHLPQKRLKFIVE